MGEKVRVVRVLEYIGERDWVEETLQRSNVAVEGIRFFDRRGNENVIKSCLLDKFPSVLSEDECEKLDLISSDIEYAKDLLEQAKLILLKNNHDNESEASIDKLNEIIKDIDYRTIPF